MLTLSKGAPRWYMLYLWCALPSSEKPCTLFYVINIHLKIHIILLVNQMYQVFYIWCLSALSKNMSRKIYLFFCMFFFCNEIQIIVLHKWTNTFSVIQSKIAHLYWSSICLSCSDWSTWHRNKVKWRDCPIKNIL